MKRFTSVLLAVVLICAMILPVAGAIPLPFKDVVQYKSLSVGAGAYIDTGFVPNKDTHVIMDVELNNQWTGLFGSILYWQDSNYFYVNTSGQDYGSGYGKNSNSWAWYTPVGGRQKVELFKSVLRIDGEERWEHDYASFYSQSMYLFAIHTDDHAEFGDAQQIRFYSCKILDNGTLVRNFVPANNGTEVGLYDLQNEEFYPFQGAVNKVVPLGEPVAAGSVLKSTNDGINLDFNGKVTVTADTTINGKPGQSAITVGEGKNVTIELQNGATLTATGGNAFSFVGGGAGIEVPASSSLTIIGDGTVKATGGNAAPGSTGGYGGKGTIDRDTEWAYTGAGGNGGYGGGGAGAGIGGRGGNGGAGGAGGAGMSYYTQRENYGGNDGSKGSNGLDGAACGKITICNTATVTATGGKANETEVAYSGGGSSDKYRFTNVYKAFGGGGGGNGGYGYAGANIGTGGGGGAGGGGGGSGMLVYSSSSSTVDAIQGGGCGGRGGAGSKTGKNGLSNDSFTYDIGLTSGKGGAGGTAGKAATEKKAAYYDLIATIPQFKDSFVFDGKQKTADLSGVGYTVTGNTGKNAGNYTATATLRKGYHWPDGSYGNKAIPWSIAKQPVPVPSSVDLCCNGNKQVAYTDQSLYTVANVTGEQIGTYTATFTLRDKVNYRWDAPGEDTGVTKVSFDIHQFVDKDHDGACDKCRGTIRYLYHVSYLDKAVGADNTVITESNTCAVARCITAEDTVWGVEGETVWYVLDSDVTLNNRPVVKGDLRVILMNGKTLTANNGITVEDKNSIRFYAQSDDKDTAGTLKSLTVGQTAIGGHNGKNGGTVPYYYYRVPTGHGENGENGGNAGKVYIFGGNYRLETSDAVCIGGGNGGNGGNGDTKADIGDNAGDGGRGGNGGGMNGVYLYGGDVSLKSDISCIGGGNGGDGGNAGNGPVKNTENYFPIYSHGDGGKGGIGGIGGDVYFYGGAVSLESVFVCIGGGKGGNGGNGSPLGNIFSRAGDGGEGGSSGRMLLFDGIYTIESQLAAAFGAGQGGTAGEGLNGHGTDGAEGERLSDSFTVSGYANIQAGESAQNAEAVSTYNGEKFLSVIYHKWEWVDTKVHRCTKCGITEEHIDNGGVCSVCKKICVTRIPQEVFCDKGGHITYFKFEGKYYQDIDCTKEITDLENWLKTDGYLAPAHTYSDEWTSNEDFHWHATTCGHNSLFLRKDKAEHIYKNGVCIVCGFDCGEPTFNSAYDTAGSVFAKPGFWGIVAVAVIAVGGGIALFIVKKKKKIRADKQ